MTDQNLPENQNTEIQSDSFSDESTAPATATTFAELITDEAIIESLRNQQIVRPTDVQLATIPLAIAGQDLIIQAKTGSGKTLAFSLPLVYHLQQATNSSTNKVFGLVLTPTRELASQIHQVIKSLSPELQPTCLIGGVDYESQLKSLKKDSRIVIGTPGRVLDFLKQKHLSLKTCEFFVLDEADEMLSMGFLEDVRAILSHLPKKRQGLFVSATITPRVDMLANSFLLKPKSVVVDVPGLDLPPIEHFYCEVGNDLMAKPLALCDFIETWRPASAVIFCNTKSDTQLVEVLLRKRGFNARRINSDLTQSQRTKIMNSIKKGEIEFLVATDIAARGLDIEQIELVINYAIHEQHETYLHRSGRTGRAGRAGRALSLIGPRDFSNFHYISKMLQVEFKKIPIPTEDEIAVARLAHLYEILRETNIDLKERDRLVARKLFSDLGHSESISEELEEACAKLCRHTAEHYLKEETTALEDELKSSEPQKEQKSDKRHQDPDKRDRNRRENNRGEDRRENRESRDTRSEKPSRKNEDSQNDSRDNRDQGNRREPRNRDQQRDPQRSSDSRNRDSARPNRDSNRNEDRRPNRDGSNDRRRNNRPNQNRENQPDAIRVYIGQGTAQGMTKKILIDLAAELAQINETDFQYISIGKEFGFAELPETQAKQLIEGLNGVHVNNSVLLVEFATLIKRKRGNDSAVSDC
jgi:ATP-dependent RNA helicase DeaD